MPKPGTRIRPLLPLSQMSTAGTGSIKSNYSSQGHGGVSRPAHLRGQKAADAYGSTPVALQAGSGTPGVTKDKHGSSSSCGVSQRADASSASSAHRLKTTDAAARLQGSTPLGAKA